MESPSLYSIATLIDGLKADDIDKRLHSIEGIPVIASAIGQYRTCKELIPFLSQLIDDEVEVLMRLSNVLPSLVPIIGENNVPALFIPLGNLYQIDDAKVRAAAVECFMRIVSAMNKSAIENQVVPFVKKLGRSVWYIGKIGAAELLSYCFKLVSEAEKGELLELVSEMLADCHPLVRKGAAECLVNLIIYVPNQYRGKVLEMVTIVSVDREDSVKLYAVNSLLTLSMADFEDTVDFIVESFSQLLENKVWRIRYLIIENISKFAIALGNANRILKPFFMECLRDSEYEVKVAACNRLYDFCVLSTGEEVVNSILPALPDLIRESDTIKIGLSINIPKLCKVVGERGTKDRILPLIESLLHQSSCEIALSIFKDLKSISEIIGPECLAPYIMPSLEGLSSDRNWRVRRQIVEILPDIGRQLGREFFESYLSRIYLMMLEDSVFSIREASILGLKDLIEFFSNHWVESKILEILLSDGFDENYIKRITTIAATKELFPLLSKGFIENKLVDIYASLAVDKVANVKINVAGAVKASFSLLSNSLVKDRLRRSLVGLTYDSDPDVKSSAEDALRVCGGNHY